jgi:hypothetical protein
VNASRSHDFHESRAWPRRSINYCNIITSTSMTSRAKPKVMATRASTRATRAIARIETSPTRTASMRTTRSSRTALAQPVGTPLTLETESH